MTNDKNQMTKETQSTNPKRDDRLELALALFVLAALGVSWFCGC